MYVILNNYYCAVIFLFTMLYFLNPVPLQLTGSLEPLHEYLDDVGSLPPNEYERGPLAGCGPANRSDRWPGNMPMQSWSEACISAYEQNW